MNTNGNAGGLMGPGVWALQRLSIGMKLLLLLVLQLILLIAVTFLAADRLMQSPWMAGSLAVGVLLLLYLFGAFHAGFSRDLRRIAFALSEVSKGNLMVPTSRRSGDELGDLMDVANVLTQGISSMVAEVRSDAALVADAGRSLVLGNRELSDRTEQQAANLEETAASVKDLAQTVQTNADTAGQTDRAAARLREVAETGAGAMTRAVQSVEAVQQSAHRMKEITAVIDSLAFQTNILALNAAVEAARAGEQGRGFAVVAAEVRTLAQRSAASAREIHQLIETSATQVESSVKQIRQAREGITEIVDGVRKVAGNMNAISSASAEQSTGLSEIAMAVAQLDELTQRNAQMVEQAVNQATRLEGRATALARAVARFKLQQGSADEAMALVHKAQALWQRTGPEQFLQQVTQANNGYHDRDMYVFALDAKGSYLAFGGNPAKVGPPVQDLPGVDGAGLLASIMRQADEAPGWVEYDITNPKSGKIQTKMSFVTRLGDFYVGCGVYKSLAG